LLTAALTVCNVKAPRIDLGHVGVFRALSRHAGLSAEAETELFEVMQTKDLPGLTALTANVAAPWREALRCLPGLYGGTEVLEKARRNLPEVKEIGLALADLGVLAEQCKGVTLSIDLAELRGLHYHTGIVFAAYCEGAPNDIARGGRYDEVGKAFGRARPATGFSLYLNELLRVVPQPAVTSAIRAPWREDQLLPEAIAALRSKGEVVIQDLPGSATPPDEGTCDRELAFVDGKWTVRHIV
jgi:ATP phosphoribosyltransferase regulatory subunit